MATTIIEKTEMNEPDEWWEEALLRYPIFQQQIAQARQSAVPTESSEEEVVALPAPDCEYPIWTPLNAFGAAETLTKMLENHKAVGA